MINRFIIIEGADNTGKTTLGRFIANRWSSILHHPTIYFHHNRTELLSRAMYDYMYSVMENLLWCYKELGQSVVLDRSWPSELMYGAVIGPPERLVEFNYGRLRQMLAETNHLYVLADCQSGMVRHLEDHNHGHSLYSPKEYIDIREKYHEWANRMRKLEKVELYDLDRHGHSLTTFCEHYFEGEYL